MKIRLCEHNKGAGKVLKRLKEEFPEQNIKLKDCLKKCGLCREAPFATVDGKPICAIDREELLVKLRLIIRN